MRVRHIREMQRDHPIGMAPSQLLGHRGTDISTRNEEAVIAVGCHQLGNGVRHPAGVQPGLVGRSEKPKPGREGTTRWKVSSSGSALV